MPNVCSFSVQETVRVVCKACKFPTLSTKCHNSHAKYKEKACLILTCSTNLLRTERRTPSCCSVSLRKQRVCVLVMNRSSFSHFFQPSTCDVRFLQDVHHCCHDMLVFPRFLSITQKSTKVLSHRTLRVSNLLMLALLLAQLGPMLASVLGHTFEHSNK